MRAGITSSTISRIEADDAYKPRLSSLEAIARALDCTVIDLLTEPEDEPEPNGKPEAKAS